MMTPEDNNIRAAGEKELTVGRMNNRNTVVGYNIGLGRAR